MYDYSKLEGKITEVFGTKKLFAKAVGLSENSIYNKLNSKKPFTQADIQKSIKALGLRQRDIPVYFFVLKVQSTEH